MVTETATSDKSEQLQAQKRSTLVVNRRKRGSKGDSKYEPVRGGRAPLSVMARILGISKGHLGKLVSQSRLPESISPDRIRLYDVDEVLRVCMRTRLPIPVVRDAKKATWGEDALWAWNAIAMGPWNCDRAPSGRAWLLYLDGKESVAARQRLSAIYVELAARETFSGFRGGSFAGPVDEADGGGGTPPESEAADQPATAAEAAMGSLDSGYMQAPFVDGESEY